MDVIDLFFNENYKILSIIHDEKSVVKGNHKFAALTQKEISQKSNISILVVNRQIQELLSEGYLATCSGKRGLYRTTQKGEMLISGANKIKNKIEKIH